MTNYHPGEGAISLTIVEKIEFGILGKGHNSFVPRNSILFTLIAVQIWDPSCRYSLH